MLKAAKIELNISKFRDRRTQNIDQVNLLVEFIRNNDLKKNDNCSHNCQNVSNQSIFEGMIMNYFLINTSKH